MTVCILSFQAANTTELWIITNGVDGGIAKTIGDAIHEERIHRISNRVQQAYSSIRSDSTLKLPKLTCIGIMPKNCITYESSFDGLVRITQSFVSVYITILLVQLFIHTLRSSTYLSHSQVGYSSKLPLDHVISLAHDFT